LKNLQDILSYFKDEIIDIIGRTSLYVEGISVDSRKVKNGYVFFALPGTKEDGKKYIDHAISNGAKVIFYNGDLNHSIKDGITYIKVNDIFKVLGIFSSSFYDFPNKYLKIFGVTGTNGKTTTANLIYHYWKSKGNKSGLIGTIDYRIDDEIYPSNFTTPQPHELQELLRRMVDKKIEYVSMELSSHALALKRIEGLEFKGVIFTNLTQDHLDFHKTMEEYFNAKMKIFNYLEQDGFGIINKDNEWTGRINFKDRKIYWVSLYDEKADIALKKVFIDKMGMFIEAITPKGQIELFTKLRGKFNIYNLLFAVGLLIASGEKLDDIAKYLATFEGVKGRLEFIEEGQDFNVIVDYAHTPDGLLNVLETIKEFTKGRIIVVFGCGGDRDPTKRDKMGEISAKLSDYVIITSDNPRTEDPLKIIRDIEVGVKRVGFKNYEIIENREEAIKKAIEIAKENDTVLIAGKGHENYQIIGTQKYPFSDQEVARKYIRERLSKHEG